MATPLRVLLVEDSEDDALLLLRELRGVGYDCQSERVQSAQQMSAALKGQEWDLILSDYTMPGFDALAALELLHARQLDIPFIIVSGTIGEETAVAALKAGAHDFIMKTATARLLPAIGRELREAASRAEQRRAGAALHYSEQRLRAVMDRVVDTIVTLDSSGAIESVNPAGEEIFGAAAGQLIGTSFTELLLEPDRAQYQAHFDAYASTGRFEILGAAREVSARRLSGAPFPLEVAMSDLRLDGEPMLIAVARDITERKQAQEQLQHLADHDPLTGLFNRRRFEQEVSRELATTARYGERGALIMFDIDNFKDVNDTLGHAHGDELIRTVARILVTRLRETDVLARLGGDEFAALLPRTGRQDAGFVAESLVDAVRAYAVMIGGKRVRLTTSAGVAPFEDADTVAEELLVRADVALYEAKESGRDRVAIYSGARGEQARMEARVAWSERIRTALETGLFVAYCQPILDLKAGTISQYELLIRMVGDGAEPIPPRAFLPTAERFGLIGEIDRFMIRRAIALLAAHDCPERPLRLEVNISARSLGDKELPALVEAELATSGVDPSKLVFEITETAAIANMDEAQRFANPLRRLGCSFALDDFGAGFGSFYYLKHLPLDYLKIDGDFIRDLPRSRTDQLVVQSMVEMGRGLGMKMVAEYVGDEATVRLLESYGVDYAQGFHIGEPADAERTLAERGAPG